VAYIEVVLNSMAWKVGRVKDVMVRCHRAFVIAKSAVLRIVWSCMCHYVGGLPSGFPSYARPGN
jgi:hypothetical protein